MRGSLNESSFPTKEEVLSGSGMPMLYRVAFQDQLDSLFKYGYNRAFTGSKGGNMYGPGVYCTFLLSDSIHNVKTKPEYGNCLTAMRLVGGYDKFIIFDGNLAKQTYGNRWRIKDQLMDVAGFDEREAAQIERSCSRQSSLYWDRTAPAAVWLWRYYEESLFLRHGVRGLIYKGNRDGHCALPYDFSSVIPVSVSYDQGRTFKTKLTDRLYNHIKDHADVEFMFGGKYKKFFQSVRGFTIIGNGSKYNIADNHANTLLSPYWFDSVDGQINPNTGLFGFSYRGIHFIGSIFTPDGGTNTGCVYDPFGDPYCDFCDLNELVNAIRQSGAKSFEEFAEMMDDDDDNGVPFESRKRNVSLTEEQFRTLVKGVVSSVLYESRTVGDDGKVTIDNFDDAKRLMNSESEDDVWFVQIIKRHKDNMHLHFERNACEFITSYLIHDADELESKRDEIMHICRATNSRAYMHINKRSKIAVTDYAEHVLKPRFMRHRDKYRMGHEIEVAAGQAKDWPERKMCFLDIDSDDERVYNKVMELLRSNGVEPMWEYRSLNNGWHILLPDKEKVRNIDFSVIDNGNKFGRFSTVGLEIDKPILLYASLKPNGYGLQQRVQARKLARRR